MTRLEKLVERAGGIHTRSCPECGGKILLTDGAPTIKPQYRYLLGCDDNDCVSVCGASVAWVVREWNRQCMKPVPKVNQASTASLLHTENSE